MIRRIVAVVNDWIVVPTMRRVMRWLAPRARIDPWARSAWRPPSAVYGAPSRTAFTEYLEGPSSVNPDSFDAIGIWLRECVANSEPMPWPEGDWHNRAQEFEKRRDGNCLDYALWGWRKLVELNYDADLVFGWVGKPHEPGSGRHAWVLVRDVGGVTFLFEPMRKEGDFMVHALQKVQEHYTPEYGVTPTGDRFTFDGSLLSTQAWLESTARPDINERTA